MAEILKKFGRYFLLDMVAQGGMAEIYRARLASADGARRLMVIKRIQAGYGGNSEFLKMFRDEIQVMMGFNHPNIIQLYDFGEESRQPYITMELVDGRNLRQFISRFIELKQPFPVELATYIIEQVASGLHYAHSFKDKISGKPLKIVHRDVSPQNILISYEGNVKVIDFGIAKAETNAESTRAGVIKGKPSYLSPEQISGEELDGRSDVFSLGAVLWEALTGKKLFAGETDLAVLKLIESCNSHVRPPSALNPKVPKELDYIVLRSLAKHRDKRYQSADEFQRALHKFLYSYMAEFNPADLAFYAKDLFKDQIVEDRKKIQRLNEEVEKLLSVSGSSPEIELEVVSPRPQLRREDATAVMPGGPPAPKVELAVGSENGAKLEVEDTKDRPAPARFSSSASRPSPRATLSSVDVPKNNAPIQRRLKKSGSRAKQIQFALAGIAALFVVSIFGPQIGIRVPMISDYTESVLAGDRLVLDGNEKNVTVIIDGRAVASQLPATVRGLKAGSTVKVSVIGAAGSFEKELLIQSGANRLDVMLRAERSLANVSAAQNQVPNLATSGGKSIELHLNLLPGGGNPVITVGGVQVNPEYPVIRVPLDSPLELHVERQEFKPLRREFVLASDQMSGLKEWIMDVQMDPVNFGLLTIKTTPSADAVIAMEGRAWVKRTPFEKEKIPVGKYNIKLTNEVLGMEKTVTVDVQEGKHSIVSEDLELKD